MRGLLRFLVRIVLFAIFFAVFVGVALAVFPMLGLDPEIRPNSGIIIVGSAVLALWPAVRLSDKIVPRPAANAAVGIIVVRRSGR